MTTIESSRLTYEPEMVLIPAGPFLMGSPKSDRMRINNEPEQLELKLDYDYAIGKYPVTVGQYRFFIDGDGYKNPTYWTRVGWQWCEGAKRTEPVFWTDKKSAGDDSLPVVGVSWYEAYAYTVWLAEATGRPYRLPTEAEWEEAARGGLEVPNGRGGMKDNLNPARIWPWGDEAPTEELCNFASNYKGGRTSPVTSHAAQAERQPYGLYHMAGNVWEWCLTQWADPYQPPPDENNEPEGASPRVLRGGAWVNDPQWARCSCRFMFYPYFRNLSWGFRVGSIVPVLLRTTATVLCPYSDIITQEWLNKERVKWRASQGSGSRRRSSPGCRRPISRQN